MHAAVGTLVQDYREQVQPRMRGLPMYNAALEVEAVGFEPYQGRLCGVLLTPWCMNLVLLPGGDDDWSALASGAACEVRLPAGDYRFTLSAPDGIEAHLSLPLFTTVQAIPDQDTAREVAREVLRRVLQPSAEQARADPVDRELDNQGLQRPLSRRELLRGRMAAEGEA